MTDLLHVGNIGAEITEEQLHDLFIPFGRVTSARIMTDSRTHAPRGFALVEMATPEDSANARNSINGLQIGGRVLTVRVLPPRSLDWKGGNDQGGSNRSHGLGVGNGGSRW